MLSKLNISCILIIILLVVILIFKINFFNSNNINYISHFIEKFANRKKNILICSAGPSFNELPTILSKYKNDFLRDCYIIAVKSTINKLNTYNICPDILCINDFSNIKKIDNSIVEKCKLKKTKIFYSADKSMSSYYLNNKTNINKNIDFIVYFKDLHNILFNKTNWNSMECIKYNKPDCINYEFKEGNIIETRWGHIMFELALPISIMLKPKNIFILGWDLNDDTHYNDKEHYTDWHNNNEIKEFTKLLGPYVKKNYNINIYKLSETQGIHLPLYNP